MSCFSNVSDVNETWVKKNKNKNKKIGKVQVTKTNSSRWSADDWLD